MYAGWATDYPDLPYGLANQPHVAQLRVAIQNTTSQWLWYNGYVSITIIILYYQWFYNLLDSATNACQTFCDNSPEPI